MTRISKLTASLLALFILGIGWTSEVQAQETIKAKPPAPKAPPKPGLTKSATAKPETKTTEDAKKTPTPGKTIPKDESAADKSDKNHADQESEAAIQKSAEAFVEAYNKHDAKAVAALFAERAEFVDEDGNLIKGRDEIEQNFANVFEASPEGKIAIEIDSIRLLTPNIALEEGLVIGTPVPDEPPTHTNYTAIHVKVDGEWKLGSVSDTDASSEQLTAQDHLQQLAWMVGDWVDENPDAIIKSSCDWDHSGNYLLFEFAVQIAGGMDASGSIRVGWDPLTRQIKSWVFDADSGYAEGLWTRIGDEWIVHMRGVNAAGEATSAVSVYRYIDDDTMSWRSYDRTVGGEPANDIPENVIKRHPPAPEVEAAATATPK